MKKKNQQRLDHFSSAHFADICILPSEKFIGFFIREGGKYPTKKKMPIRKRLAMLLSCV